MIKLKSLLKESNLDPKASKFLDTIQINDRNIRDLRDVSVQSTPQGNWTVFYKGKKLCTVGGKLLDEPTIRKYHLEQ